MSDENDVGESSVDALSKALSAGRQGPNDPPLKVENLFKTGEMRCGNCKAHTVLFQNKTAGKWHCTFCDVAYETKDNGKSYLKRRDCEDPTRIN